MASMNTTPLSIAIQDPFGFGYEGRIGVTREFSSRRAGMAAVLSQYAQRSTPAPPSVQYWYLLYHGYYTADELINHPGRPARQDQTPEARAAEEESNRAAEEIRMREQNEYLAERGEERWRNRAARIRGWRDRAARIRGSTGNFDYAHEGHCRCPECPGPQGMQLTTQW